LQVIHEGEKVVVLELVISVPTKEVEQQGGVHWLSCSKKKREKNICYCYLLVDHVLKKAKEHFVSKKRGPTERPARMERGRGLPAMAAGAVGEGVAVEAAVGATAPSLIIVYCLKRFFTCSRNIKFI
jgi:hypothetical protein